MSKVFLTLIAIGMLCLIIYITYNLSIAGYKKMLKNNKKKK